MVNGNYRKISKITIYPIKQISIISVILLQDKFRRRRRRPSKKYSR